MATIAYVGPTNLLFPGTRQDGGFGNLAPEEFLFKKSTKYLFRINNTSNGSSDYVLQAFWIETYEVE